MKINSTILVTQLSLLLIFFMLSGSCKKKETSVPAVVTDPLSSVTTTSAKGGGLILDDGGGEILARGICWSVHPMPTVIDGNAPGGSGMGFFTATLTGLSPNTLYYVRTYATNEAGTGYSDQIALKTMFGTMTDIDGNIYQTVRIGNQEWMAENLKVTHYNNQAAIPNVSNYAQWTELTTGAFSWYDNDFETFGQYYGALYNWFALTDSSSLCPDGWHIPSIGEWDTLCSHLGGASVAGGKLKSGLTAWHEHPYWNPPNYFGTNESGFSAFPGGFRSSFGGFFSDLGPSGYWWSSTPDEETIAGIWLSTHFAGAYYELYRKNSGVSVRCVRD